MRYVKPDQSQPVLATYILDGECFLLADLPQGESRAISLADLYDVQTIRDACYANREGLVLPRQAVEMLSEWLPNASDTELVALDIRWEDPVNDFCASVDLRDADEGDGHTVAKAAYLGSCPFRLPKGFVDADAQVQPKTMADEGSQPKYPMFSKTIELAQP
jgi:hypothetical protein